MPRESQSDREEPSATRPASKIPREEATPAQLAAPVDPHPVIALQRTLGNRWVQRRIATVRRSASASAGPQGGPLEDELVNRIQTERSGGQALEPGQRQNAEHALGADLSSVRVHTGSAAADLSDQLGARAFTTGRDIFFGAQTSPADTDVLLHESAHAVQQGMSTDAPAQVGAADTPYEQAADSAASGAPAARKMPDEEDAPAGAGK